MTGEDLKRLQDHFLEGGKMILRESGRLRPVGFVITLHKHVEKIFETGWGVEIIDPASCVRDGEDDRIADADPGSADGLEVNVPRGPERVPQTRDAPPPYRAR